LNRIEGVFTNPATLLSRSGKDLKKAGKSLQDFSKGLNEFGKYLDSSGKLSNGSGKHLNESGKLSDESGKGLGGVKSCFIERKQDFMGNKLLWQNNSSYCSFPFIRVCMKVRFFK
jgi:hypothetical protein